MSKPRIIGELVIVAYKAKDLPEREVVGKQDPFVVFRLGETIAKTKTDLRGGQHPTWDDQVNLPVPEKKKMIVVQVYDEDAKRQELISETELDISKVLEEGEEDDWYPLQYKGRPAGEIYLEMTFYSAKPPPKRTPTRYGMSKHYAPRPTGYAQHPPLPQQQQQRPYPASPQYPPQSTNNVRPPAPIPIESHSTPTYGKSPYPPQQQQQRPPPHHQQYINASPYPPPAPTPSMSTGSQHMYPPQQQQPRPINNNGSRPSSYVAPAGPTSRPTSPPGPSSYGSNNSASLLSSSYTPGSSSGGPPRPNSSYGGYPHSNSGYPPANNNNSGYPPYPPVSNANPNRNSYPNYSSNSSPYPPHQQSFGGFPEPQQFSSGYVPHADTLGTPFAAHQGSFSGPYPPANSSHSPYPPHQQQQGYPPPNNNTGGYPPQQQHYPPY